MLAVSRILCYTEIDSFLVIKVLLHKVWALTECICKSQVTYRYGISITMTLSRAHKHTHKYTRTQYTAFLLLKVLYLSLVCSQHLPLWR
jgi:hypothetical protein